MTLEDSLSNPSLASAITMGKRKNMSRPGVIPAQAGTHPEMSGHDVLRQQADYDLMQRRRELSADLSAIEPRAA